MPRFGSSALWSFQHLLPRHWRAQLGSSGRAEPLDKSGRLATLAESSAAGLHRHPGAVPNPGRCCRAHDGNRSHVELRADSGGCCCAMLNAGCSFHAADGLCVGEGVVLALWDGELGGV